jgi:hypothetical protein
MRCNGLIISLQLYKYVERAAAKSTVSGEEFHQHRSKELRSGAVGLALHTHEIGRRSSM